MKKLMMMVALLFFLTGSAWAAAEWNFYGSARVSTFYTNFDNNMLDSASGGNPILGTGSDTDKYEQDLNGNARIGANVKVSDSVTGRFEYGAKDDVANVRILWGEWDFGAGSLGVGKHYTPLLFPYSNQVYNIYAMKDGDTNMSLFGMLYGKREAQVRLKFGNFQIAAVEPRTTVYHDYVAIGTTGSYSLASVGGSVALPGSQPATEITLPNIQAKYKVDFDWGHINLAGGFQSFDVVDGNEKYDVTSYVLGIGGRLNVGKAYFKGNVWGGQNVGNLVDILVGPQVYSTTTGLGTTGKDKDGADVGFARWRDGSLAAAGQGKGITDNDALAGLIVAGYEIRRGLYLEAGYGYTQTELNENNATTHKLNTWYLQSTIFLAEGVFITPEVGGLDGEDDTALDILYAGIKWQINF